MNKILQCFCFLFAFLLLFSSCAGNNVIVPKETPTPSNMIAVPDEAPEDAALILERGDLMRSFTKGKAATKIIDERFSDAQRAFSAKLFSTIAAADPGKNLIISPLSVTMALAMTANGAAGKTKDELEKLLGDGMSIEELNAYLAQLASRLPGDECCRVSLADALFIKEEFSAAVKDAYLQNIADYYNAGVFRMPFDGAALAAINDWVKEHTDGMIEKILEQLSPDVLMVLLNALCFEADWADPYTEKAVEEGVFHGAAGDQTVKMLKCGVSTFLEDTRRGCHAVGFAKPYANGSYSFVLLLPDEGIDLKDYIASLTPDALNAVVKSERSAIVTTEMPKFKSEYSKNLNSVLKALGIPTAFDANKADFSGIADKGLYIGSVIHKGYIEVTENGTRAAAATAVGMCGSAAPKEMQTVIADRPFVYMILGPGNVPLFIGALYNVN